MRIGIDIGGTFTDVYAVDDATGEVIAFKTHSTPEDPSEAIANGLERLRRTAGDALDRLAELRHGTTVATNALIERSGGRVAMVTTKGFGDLLDIGRQTRPKIYDIQADYPAPLIPRALRFEAEERVGPDGAAIIPLADAEIARLVAEVLAAEPDAVAVSFLFSFLRPDHELRLAEALRSARPSLFVSTSAETQPEFREYERFSTNALNAYLQPVVSNYVERVERLLAETGSKAPVLINQSAGGLMAAERARRVPIRTALSGPAAGVVGAIEAGARSGFRRLVTLDMGGTSTDVCLIEGDAPPLAFERDIAGFPVRLPSIDVNAVGAGGGSIVAVGGDGLMTVGPRSARAHPGPACYGRGGTQPTLSDANLILGRLPVDIAGGDMRLDLAAARRAFEPIAEALGVGVEEAALGATQIVASNVVRAIRAVSIERGRDPRGAALAPYGGAGGLHAADVADALGMRTILAPPAPGLLCARGLLASDLAESFVATRRTPLDGDLGELLTTLAELTASAERWLGAAGRAEGRLETWFDMRYVGQNYELAAPADGFDGSDRDALRVAFFAEHRRAYGHADETAPVEIVNIRLLARIAGAPAPHPPLATPETPPAPRTRPVWFALSGPVETWIFERRALALGALIDGPAIVEQEDATTLVPPGWRVRRDAADALIMEKA